MSDLKNFSVEKSALSGNMKDVGQKNLLSLNQNFFILE